MKLIGLLESSLGGFITIRGYADFSDLQNISKAESLQRDLIIEHRDEISEYLQKRDEVFFPEVILSYTLKYDYNKLESSGVDPLDDIRNKKEFKSNIDDIVFSARKSGEHIVTVKIDDEWAIRTQPFSRLDGNHRLSAKLTDDKFSKTQYPTPFCLILFSDVPESEKSKLTIFNNINSKAKALTSEEVLKNILGEKSKFSESEIQTEFGEDYLLTHRIALKIPTEHLSRFYKNLVSAFTNKKGDIVKYTTLLDVVRFFDANNTLKDIKEEEKIDRIIEALEEVNQEFRPYSTIKAIRNQAFMLSALHLYLIGTSISSFLKWVSSNHLGELTEVAAQSLFGIYQNIYTNDLKIFVAMPYYSTEEVRTYNQIYGHVINKLNSENTALNLSMFEIMTHHGATKDIVVDMFQKIDSSQIFIADITEARANVAYELGYARARKIPTIIVRKTDDKVDVPFDYEHDSRVPYNLSHSVDFQDKLYHHIKAVLIEDYECKLV